MHPKRTKGPEAFSRNLERVAEKGMTDINLGTAWGKKKKARGTSPSGDRG